MSAIKPVKIVAELTLPHKRFCSLSSKRGFDFSACQCLNEDYETGESCNMGFDASDYWYINLDNGEIQKQSPSGPSLKVWTYGVLRSQACIDQHGEGVEA